MHLHQVPVNFFVEPVSSVSVASWLLTLSAAARDHESENIGYQGGREAERDRQDKTGPSSDVICTPALGQVAGNKIVLLNLPPESTQQTYENYI